MKTSMVLLMLVFGIHAQAAVKYKLTLTNGSAMPVSPAAVYVINGQNAAALPGQMATPGFVQLCQTGNPSGRIPELSGNSAVTFVAQTTSPIMPGESRTIEVDVHDPSNQSVHFEAMYGKTKDLCAAGGISGHSLLALKQHAVNGYVGKDDVLATGTFADPVVGHYSCSMAMNAVGCLRELSAASSGTIHYFSSYLPSILSFLEGKFGATETQSLIVPSSGGVRFTLELKH